MKLLKHQVVLVLIYEIVVANVMMLLAMLISPVRTEYLQNFITKFEQGRIKLIDVCRTRWICRIDGLDLIEKRFIYISETMEYFNLKSTISIDTSIKAETVQTYIPNIDLIFFLVIT